MEELPIIQITLYVIGGGLFLLSVYRHRKYKSLESWIEVPATIKRVKEGSSLYSYRGSTFELHYPLVLYSYNYKGKKIESSNVSLDLSNIWIPLSNDIVTEQYDGRFWYKWKQGLIIKAFINPKNPNKSVLINQMSKNFIETNKSIIALALIIVLFSFFMVPWLATYLKLT